MPTALKRYLLILLSAVDVEIGQDTEPTRSVVISSLAHLPLTLAVGSFISTLRETTTTVVPFFPFFIFLSLS